MKQKLNHENPNFLSGANWIAWSSLLSYFSGEEKRRPEIRLRSQAANCTGADPSKDKP